MNEQKTPLINQNQTNLFLKSNPNRKSIVERNYFSGINRSNDFENSLE